MTYAMNIGDFCELSYEELEFLNGGENTFAEWGAAIAGVYSGAVGLGAIGVSAGIITGVAATVICSPVVAVTAGVAGVLSAGYGIYGLFN